MKQELKDWMNSINHSKEHLMIDEESKKSYNPYIINKILSGFTDTVMQSNFCNMNPSLPKEMQYDFLLNSIRPRKRFTPWLKKEFEGDLDMLKKYYNLNTEKSKQTLKILTKEQLEYIRKRLDTGGKIK